MNECINDLCFVRNLQTPPRKNPRNCVLSSILRDQHTGDTQVGLLKAVG